MSDTFRQSNTDKAASALKPDSQKSTLESATDSLKGSADSVAGKAQPNDTKSTTQKATDSGGSMLDSAKDAIGLGDKK